MQIFHRSVLEQPTNLDFHLSHFVHFHSLALQYNCILRPDKVIRISCSAQCDLFKVIEFVYVHFREKLLCKNSVNTWYPVEIRSVIMEKNIKSIVSSAFSWDEQKVEFIVLPLQVFS